MKNYQEYLEKKIFKRIRTLKKTQVDSYIDDYEKRMMNYYIKERSTLIPNARIYVALIDDNLLITKSAYWMRSLITEYYREQKELTQYFNHIGFLYADQYVNTNTTATLVCLGNQSMVSDKSLIEKYVIPVYKFKYKDLEKGWDVLFELMEEQLKPQKSL